MTEHYDEYNQSNDDNDTNTSDDKELATDDRIGERRRAEQQQRLLTQIAQSMQDASDELRLMNDNIENLTRGSWYEGSH
jgi:hypothetical protein